MQTNPSTRRITPPPREELQSMYGRLKSMQLTSEQYAVSEATVSNWLDSYKIPKQSRGGVDGRYKRPEVTDEMIVADFKESLNLTESAERRGTTRPMIARRRVKLGIWQPDREYKHASERVDWQEAARLYAEGWTIEKLAEHYHVGEGTIYRGFEEHGISRRHRAAHMKAWHAKQKQKLAEYDQLKLRLELERGGSDAQIAFAVDEIIPQFERLISLPEVKASPKILLQSGWLHPDFALDVVTAMAGAVESRKPQNQWPKIAAIAFVAARDKRERNSVRRAYNRHHQITDK